MSEYPRLPSLEPVDITSRVLTPDPRLITTRDTAAIIPFNDSDIEIIDKPETPVN